MKKQVSNMSADEGIHNFVENLMTDKKLEFAGDTERQEAYRDLEKQVEERIERAIYGALPDDRLKAVAEEYRKDEPDERRITDLVIGSGIDMGVIVADAMMKFRDEYLKEGK